MDRRTGKTTRKAMSAVQEFLDTGQVILRDTCEVPCQRHKQTHILGLFERILNAITSGRVGFAFRWTEDGWLVSRCAELPNQPVVEPRKPVFKCISPGHIWHVWYSDMPNIIGAGKNAREAMADLEDSMLIVEKHLKCQQ